MSIHQPRYSIFKQCDTLTLLSLGNVVYHGSAQSALRYFETIGKVRNYSRVYELILSLLPGLFDLVKHPSQQN